MSRLLHARAYRDGAVVCDRVLVTVVASDERLGLTPRERRQMTVRFVHGIEPGFRAQLMQVLRGRGARSRRLAAALDPIELELDGERRLAADRAPGGAQPRAGADRLHARPAARLTLAAGAGRRSHPHEAERAPVAPACTRSRTPRSCTSARRSS